MKIKIGQWQDGLTDEQLAVVTAPIDKPVVVLAGPGSGKTLVSVRRLAWLAAQGLDPKKLVAVTFSQKMAEELFEKAKAKVPDLTDSRAICTIHGFCLRLLREFGVDRAIAKDWVVKNAIQAELDRLGSTLNVSSVKWWLDRAKAAGYGRQAETADVRAFLSNMFRGADVSSRNIDTLLSARDFVKGVLDSKNQITFADMIADVAGLLSDSETRKVIAGKFDYVIVDEGQDTLALPMKILRQIAGDRFFIVGDTDQLLYRFIGATPEDNLYNTDGVVYKLTANYRSVPEIVTAANNLIAGNYSDKTKKFRKVMVPIRPADGRSIFVDHHATPEDEAKAVARDIFDFYQPGEVFVTARTNAQLGYVERELFRLSVPYLVNKDDGGLFSRSHVADLVAYLQLIARPGNNDAFERVYNIASDKMVWRGQSSVTRHLGRQFLEDLRLLDDVYWNALKHPKSFKGWLYQDGVDDLVSFVFDCQDQMWHRKTAGDMLAYILDHSYRSYVVSKSATNAVADGSLLEDLAVVLEIAKEYDVQGFLDFVRRITKEKAQSKDKVAILSTIHSLKGAERPVVFGIGWSEGLLPHQSALEDNRWQAFENSLPVPNTNTVNDERCLAYVLVTRAKSEVRLSSIKTWRGQTLEPSRFIKELGYE